MQLERELPVLGPEEEIVFYITGPDIVRNNS
jgi:hypothetical protein